jgi:hypothetical protein
MNGERSNQEKLFYSYSIDSGSIASGGTATGSIAIEADADFVITKASYFATDGAGTSQTANSRIIPLVTVQIQDTGSGRNLLDSAQPIPNLFGVGREPFIWPVAQVVRANSVVRFTFTSLEASNTRRVFLSLIGFKLYRYS